MSVDLSITVNGIHFKNPFLLASGPPGTNARVISKSFDLGWGGAVTKTICLDSSIIINTAPRYTKYRDPKTNNVIGFTNIELISDRPIEIWEKELVQLKKNYSDRPVIASIAASLNQNDWQQLAKRIEATGVDGFELNLSCPHGLPDKQMGMALGEDAQRVEQVISWVKDATTLPVWVKMTPNIGSPIPIVHAAQNANVDGFSSINTILSLVGVNLDTLRPQPTVEGYTTPGGYSGVAVKPIALRHVMEIARACHDDVSVSGIGGIVTGADAAQFILFGASTVQVCTGAMLHGYEIIQSLTKQLSDIMEQHAFTHLSEMVGKSIPYVTTHADLVDVQEQAKQQKARPQRDNDWKGEIASETDALITQ